MLLLLFAGRRKVLLLGRVGLITEIADNRYNFSIDGHRMTVIEADGVETNPLDVDSFEIFPGQRYSVVVSADQPVDNYCTHFLPLAFISLFEFELIL